MKLLCPNCKTEHRVAGMFFSDSVVNGKPVPFTLDCISCNYKWEPKESDHVKVVDDNVTHS